MTDNNKTPDFEPPLACVNRIIKSCLNDNIQVTKDARASFTRAAGIFIFYITHCANDFAKENKRSTISVPDILHALKELEFDAFIEPLETFLAEYKKEGENESSQPKKKAKKSNEEIVEGGDEVDEEINADNVHDDENEAEDGVEDDENEAEVAEEDIVEDNDEDDKDIVVDSIMMIDKAEEKNEAGEESVDDDGDDDDDEEEEVVQESLDE